MDISFSQLMSRGCFISDFQKDPLHFLTFQASPTSWSVLIRANYNLRKALRLRAMRARVTIWTYHKLQDVPADAISTRVRALVMRYINNCGIISPRVIEAACSSIVSTWINCNCITFHDEL